MKKIYLLVIGCCLVFVVKAQLSKTVELTSGNLSSILTEEEKNTITSLTLVGTVDARDFITTAQMPQLTELDLSQTRVTAVNTVFADRVAISYPDTISSTGYNPRESSSLFSARLTSLKLPSTLKAIGQNGLAGCSGLTSIEIPPTVVSIGLYAFWGCTGLTSLDIPSSVTYIETYAFYECSGLKELTLSPSIGEIKANTFSGCSSLTTLTIPSPIGNIGESAFLGCTALTTVILPESLSGIDHVAFLYCPNITSIYSYNPIPPAMTKGTFDADKSVCTVYVPYGSGPLYASAQGWNEFTNIVESLPGFSLSATSLSFDMEEQSATVEVSSPIPWTAQSDQSWLTVSPLSGNANQTLTLSAEANNTQVSRTANVRVSVSESLTKNISVVQQGIRDTIHLETSGLLATRLTEQELANITRLTITGVMDARDFRTIRYKIPLLEMLDINAVSIEAFLDTTYGNHILYPANALPRGRLFGDDFMRTDYDLSGHLHLSILKLPASLTTISAWSLQGLSQLMSVEIPSGVTTIGREAFAMCNALPSITLPSSVTEIGMEAFAKCGKLATIELPPSLKIIEEATFDGCNSLLTIDIPDSVTTIKDRAFQFCKNLTTVTIPKTVTTIGNQAFSWCLKLQSIYSYPEHPVDIADVNALVFDYVDKTTCTLYVPFGTRELYANALGWKDFLNIVEMEGFRLSATELSFGAGASEKTLDVISNLAWTAVSNQQWLTVSPPLANGDEEVTITVLDNETSEERTGTITFMADNDYSLAVHVTQQAMVNSIPMANAGPDQTVEEGALVHLDGSASSDADDDVLTYEWTAPEGITLSDVNIANPTFTAPKTEQDTTLTFTLVVNDGKENSVSDKVVITVTNRIIELGVSIHEIAFESRASSAKVIITGNAFWTASSDKDWLIITPSSGEGAKEIRLSAPANETTTERTAIITISAPETEPETMTVTQKGLVTSVDQMTSSMAITCFPNPFTSQMNIEVLNPSLREVNIEIYTMNGQKIKTLAKGLKGAKISLLWKGDDEKGRQVPEGMYVVKMNGQTRKVVKEL